MDSGANSQAGGERVLHPSSTGPRPDPRELRIENCAAAANANRCDLEGVPISAIPAVVEFRGTGWNRLPSKSHCRIRTALSHSTTNPGSRSTNRYRRHNRGVRNTRPQPIRARRIICKSASRLKLRPSTARPWQQTRIRCSMASLRSREARRILLAPKQ